MLADQGDAKVYRVGVHLPVTATVDDEAEEAAWQATAADYGIEPEPF